MASQSDINEELDSFATITDSGILSHTITTEAESGSVSTRHINTKRATSSIHAHTRIPLDEERRRTGKVYFCKYCPPNTPRGAHISTQGLKLHLKKHGVDWSAEQNEIRTTPKDIGVASLKELYEKLAEKGEAKGFEGEVLRRTIEKKAVKETLVDLIVVRRLPFRCVEWLEFHAFIKALNREAETDDTIIPVHHQTISNWVMARFKDNQDIVRKLLQSAKTKIHLAVDIWTSPNHSLVLGICASFVDLYDSYHNILIGLRTVLSQGGEDQWEALHPVLVTYGIKKKIGAVISNNAPSNDVLCRTISAWLFTEHEIRWNATY